LLKLRYFIIIIFSLQKIMENMVRDDRCSKAASAISYRKKILPLISYGLLVMLMSQQASVILSSNSVKAATIIQESVAYVNLH